MVNGPMAVNAPSSRISPAPIRASLGGTPSMMLPGPLVLELVLVGAGVSMVVKPLGVHRRMCRQGSDAIGEPLVARWRT